MKKLALFSAITFAILLVSVLSGVGIANAGHNDGLLGYWPAEGDALDSSGHNNHGTSFSGVFAPGRVGQAFSFDGNDHVAVPDSDSWAFGNNDFTVNLWANFSSIPAATSDHDVIFIGNDQGGGNNPKWFFAFGSGKLNFHVVNPTAGFNKFIAKSNFTPATNRWYHLAVTRTNNFFEIYVDGVSVGSEAGITVAIPNATASLTIGQAESLGFMRGLVDEVRIYDRALSSAELKDQAGTPISHWKADGDALDSVDGNDGTLIGGSFGPGKFGQAFSFDGLNDYVQVGNPPNLNFDDTLTISAWIYPTGPGNAAGGFGGIIVNKEGEYEIARLADGTINWAFANSNPGWVWKDTGIVAPLNQWTHIAVVYDSGKVSAYGNGQIPSSSPDPNPFNGSGSIGNLGSPHVGQDDFRIGGRQGATQYFRGRIDDVKVFGRALSAAQVQAQFTGDGSQPDPQGLISNGGFEAGNCSPEFNTLGVGNHQIIDWSVVSGTIDYVCGYWQNSDGLRSLDLNGNGQGAISQSIATVPGERYFVQFDMAGNPVGGSTTKTLLVDAASFSDTFTFNTGATSRTSMGWQEKSFTFTASGDNTILKFTSQNFRAYGPALDNVRVTLVVNQAPTAFDDAYNVDEDQTLTALDGTAVPGVLANDSEPNFDDTLTAVLVDDVSNGNLTLNSDDGSFTYTPDTDFNGTDSFTYKANDGTVDSNTVTVTITVTAVNDEPSFNKGADESVLEDAGAQTVSGWATGFDAGAANESGQTISSYNVSNTNSGLFSGQPAINTSGDLTYTPADDANGASTVTVSVTDSGGTANGGDNTSPSQNFTITVTAVNDEPSFTKGADESVLEDAGAQTVPGWATGFDAGAANESGQTISSYNVSNTNSGLFSAQPAINTSGDLTYTPADDANGASTVTVSVTDSGGTANGGDNTSPSQNFTITVTAVNDAPVANPGGPYTGFEGSPVSFDGGSSSDVDVGDTLTFEWTFAPAGTGTGVSPSHTFADNGPPYEVCLTVTDNGSPALDDTKCTTATISNVAPVLGTGKIVVNNDEWTFTDTGFTNAPTAAQFALNVADYFTGGAPGSFLAYSGNFGLTGSQLDSTLTDAGHTWTLDDELSLPSTLATLQQYDAVFLMGNAVDNQVLIDYVNAGGNVYLGGGTGEGGPVLEAARWNTFLNAFGLEFAPTYNGVVCSCVPVSGHPLLAGVESMYFANGNSVSVTDPDIAQVLFSSGTHGLLAVSAIGSVSANSIDEGQSTTLNVSFTDPGVLDAHTVDIDWGDSSSGTNFSLSAGVLSFSTNHIYLDDDPTATPSDNYTITITVSDLDGGSDSDTTAITVNNLAPMVFLEDDAAVENFSGQIHQINATYADLGSLDTHTITIDWGEGPPEPAVFVSEDGGVVTVTGSHRYFTPDIYTIRVTVEDDDLGSNFVEQEKTVKILPVAIDIKPSINLSNNGNGVIPVVVLSGTYEGVVFDGSTIVGDTLLFEGAQIAHEDSHGPMSHYRIPEATGLALRKAQRKVASPGRPAKASTSLVVTRCGSSHRTGLTLRLGHR